MVEGNSNGKRDFLQKTILWIGSVLVALNISIIGYVATNLHDLEVRLARIEANRFTNGDGTKFLERISDIQRHVAAIPLKIPPQWFKEYVYENRTRIKELEKRK